MFDRVTPQMRIGSEEIFGPVMAVMSWSASPRPRSRMLPQRGQTI